MPSSDPEHELKSALDAFETSLATPVISGELDAWSDQVHGAWSRLLPQVDHHLFKLHAKQYQEIAKQDPALLPQVEQMKAEDAALAIERDHVSRLVDLVAGLAPIVEPDERKATKANEQLVSDGVTFVVRLRKQLVTVRTWYVEAFNRDRGVAD